MTSLSQAAQELSLVKHVKTLLNCSEVREIIERTFINQNCANELINVLYIRYLAPRSQHNLLQGGGDEHFFHFDVKKAIENETRFLGL